MRLYSEYDNSKVTPVKAITVGVELDFIVFDTLVIFGSDKSSLVARYFISLQAVNIN